MTASLGVLLPLTAHPYATDESTLVRSVVDEGLVEGLWVRDLPCVPAGDRDGGQGSDPFAHIAMLVGARILPATVGTASVILGVRHPLVIARAVAGLQHATGGRLVLGVGTGGKPAMNRALGIEDRSMARFAEDWRALRSALRAVEHGSAPGFDILAPPGYQPPPVQLATSDLTRWEAIDGDAEGWQTFATTPDTYLRDYERVCAIRGGPTDVAVRIDATVVPGVEAGSMLPPTHRGRIFGSEQHITQFVSLWRQLPVRDIVLAVRAPDPHRILRDLAGS